jgi:ketosteroid isomerase-like protein
VATFQNVRINQLGPEATRWLHEVLTALDAKDVDAYTGFMADDVEVSFNNGDMTMRGRDAVRDGLAQFWQSFGTLAHDELNIDGTDRNLVHESAQLLHDARRAGGDHSGGGMGRPRRRRQRRLAEDLQRPEPAVGSAGSVEVAASRASAPAVGKIPYG